MGVSSISSSPAVRISAARFIRLMGKIEDIMCEHRTIAKPMDLLCSILGHRKDPVRFEGPALSFGQLDIDTSFFEEKMVSKILAAVFSEDDTTAQDCKLILRIVRMLVSTLNRVHAQLSCSILRSQNRQIRKAHFVSSFHQIWEIPTGTTSFWGTTHGCCT